MSADAITIEGGMPSCFALKYFSFSVGTLDSRREPLLGGNDISGSMDCRARNMDDAPALCVSQRQLQLRQSAVRQGMIGDKIRGCFSNRQSTRARLYVIEHCHSLIGPAEIEEQPTISLPNSGLSEDRAQHPSCCVALHGAQVPKLRQALRTSRRTICR